MIKEGNVWLMAGDCLNEMKKVPEGSVDLVLCDPPYGTTRNEWDSVIPLDLMWREGWRVLKPTGAAVLTAAQPFTSEVVCSQLRNFKYQWVWEKSVATGFLNAKKQPLRAHEDVIVFYRKQPTYNPQMVEGAQRRTARRVGTKTSNYGRADKETFYDSTRRYPRSVQKFTSERGAQHPTQKPVSLMAYLIKTYTNEGDTVLDFTMGSGTTGVAAMQCSRRFIGIEKDFKHFGVACERVMAAKLCQPCT